MPRGIGQSYLINPNSALRILGTIPYGTHITLRHQTSSQQDNKKQEYQQITLQVIQVEDSPVRLRLIILYEAKCGGSCLCREMIPRGNTTNYLFKLSLTHDSEYPQT